MRPTLNLFDHLLARGRRFQSLGRHGEAGRLFARLATFRDLPAAVAEEAQLRLAELSLRRRHYARARRHLRAALRHHPGHARYHFLMATALRADDGCDPEQAAEHYRRALERGPTHLRCRCDAGLLELRLGRTDAGLALLRQAAEQSPDSAEAVGKLARGLMLAGRPDEARAALRAALFRNPRSPRFRKLWADLQMRLLRRQHDTDRRDETADEGPVLLPFARPEVTPPEGVRQDAPSPLPPPHPPRLLRRPSRRVW
jgi:tetratricopeptide (TPR) repeat protein